MYRPTEYLNRVTPMDDSVTYMDDSVTHMDDSVTPMDDSVTHIDMIHDILSHLWMIHITRVMSHI